jgi:hypothetical protein
LLALVFVAGRATTEDARVREAVARSIDRAAIVNFILQKEGEPAGGLLPQWSSGIAFLFPTQAESTRAKELWLQIAPSPRIVLGYDSGDPLEQTIAERIVVNARESGILLVPQAIQPVAPASLSGAGNLDARLIRLRMPSPHPGSTLVSFLSVLGPLAGLDTTVPPETSSPEAIYACEHDVVGGFRVVPLVWLPQVYGLSGRVRDWKVPAAGESWPLADVWLEGPAEPVGEGEAP